MMRRASLESHVPAGETWGGGGFGGVWSVILVKRKCIVSRRSTMRVETSVEKRWTANSYHLERMSRNEKI